MKFNIAICFLLASLSLFAQQTKKKDDKVITEIARASVVTDTSRYADIRLLMQITGVIQQMEQSLDQMIEIQKTQNKNVSDEFWAEFKAEFIPLAIERIIPLYEKYYSEDDLRQLLTFYNTPLGKKLIAVQPQILNASVSVGTQLGTEVAMRVAARLETTKKKKKE